MFLRLWVRAPRILMKSIAIGVGSRALLGGGAGTPGGNPKRTGEPSEAGIWGQIRQSTSLDRAGLSSCDGRRVEYPGVQRPVDPKPLNPLQFRFCPAPWARQDKKNDRRSRPARAAELRKQP